MVISHILGGLGNQMFQYAAARALSLRIQRSLLLDLSDFSNYTLHQGFELERVFNLSVKAAQRDDVKKVLGWQRASLLRRVIKRPIFSFLRKRSFLVEPHFNYWSQLESMESDCYLMGYWQSERYFESIRQTIRKDFEFRQPLCDRNLELAKDICNTQSVSMHIRRGDYVSDSKTKKILNVCSLEYYRKSIDYVSNCINSPTFFVFSDDMDWVRSNIKIPFPCVFVDHNHGVESYRDMQLMSLCKNNVIANSTFSWWGAWLNTNDAKIVTAPKEWFVGQPSPLDLYPSTWVVL